MADSPRRRRPLAAFLLGCLLTAGLAAALYFGLARRGAPSAADAQPVFDRQEFTRRVLGRTEAEVLAAVGPPDTTSEDDGTKYWHFKRRTRDPMTAATDSDVQVIVMGGTAVAVNF